MPFIILIVVFELFSCLLVFGEYWNYQLFLAFSIFVSVLGASSDVWTIWTVFFSCGIALDIVWCVLLRLFSLANMSLFGIY